ncbi:MAG: TonB-dependent receptor, partial [Bacteroidetes bacterium]|nr:TonB-dependent receptor [Bacteroidota bacterium]
MREKLHFFLALILFTSVAQILDAQTGLKGVVKDSGTEETLIGATVVLKGTNFGTSTDIDGTFKFEVPAGSYKLTVTYIGYDTVMREVTVITGQMKTIGNIELKSTSPILTGVSIMADRAKGRETPVAFSNIGRKQISEQLGSRDIPQSLDVTPNVYATAQGGGAGDARINVRGFNQRNVAVMINGVPMNDMENGWVWGSNWDGVGDATSSIQMQRGLSAVNLATPSIGGTMNIITNPAEHKAGMVYKQEFGTGNFLKSTVFGHTGLINGKYALSAGGVRKTGQGVIDKTWTDAWAYYLGAAWNINSMNRLELYAIGAPQIHGQNSYKQNIAAYSHGYAEELDYPDSALMQYPEAQAGRYYNQNWGPVSFKYDGKQYWNGKEHERYNPHYINERENYFHKPLVNLNWFTKWSEKVTQYTVAYYSGGTGGGSGTKGSMKWDYSGPSRFVDFDATIANNTLSDTAKGVLRNSVNNQWTLGLISKLQWNVSQKVKTSFGIDSRTAEVDHFREVRDLLGGKVFIDYADDFSTEHRKYLGDKVDYHNTNTIRGLGGFAQAEYNYGNITAYGVAGYSMIKYSYINHFEKAENGEDKLTAKTDWIGGYQVKGGMSYRFTRTLNAFINLGYVSKVPIFDAVIDDVDGRKAENPKNEKFIAFEGGAQ